ncbi:MAG: kelch repeat-containing protein [Candidatus Acidiferrum sp.]|jgi:hypothetical protein
MALALLSFLFGVPSSVTFAQQGKFVPTGSMATARGVHTATLLNNGKVLIAGGEQDAATVFLASAELYDPTTRSFSPTGNLDTARWAHTATRLNDGKVLIAGGENKNGTLTDAELYDPSTGTFSPTGDLNTPRSFHTATLLNNGMVLIAGGCCYVASAELYDPTTGTFSPTGSLNVGREYSTATLLKDGKALLVGGNAGQGDLASAELYDPTTGTFTTTGSLNSAERYQAATLLNDGTVLITGGIDFPTVAELFNPNTGSFAVTGPLMARWLHSATLLSDGTVLVAGGYDGTNDVSSAQLYGPATGTFSLTGSLNTARWQQTATVLNDGTVLIAGGEQVSGISLASAELYQIVHAPVVSLSATSVVFGDQPLGTTSATQTVILQNAGSANLSIQAVALAGPNGGDFAIGNGSSCTNGASLGVNSTCTIQITFTPTGSGTRNATVSIIDNAADSPESILLSGTTAPAPSVSVTPQSATFASQYVGTSGLPKSVTVMNHGSAALDIGSVTASPDDFGTLSACGNTLAPGSSCAIGVFFEPTTSGPRTGTLTINDNAPGSPQTVALSGTGQDFSMAPVAPTATVTAGQSATYSLSLLPDGGFSQTVSFGCTGAPEFSTCVVSPSSVTLNGAKAATVTVTVSTTSSSFVVRVPWMSPPDKTNFRLVLVFVLLLILGMVTALVGSRPKRTHSLAAVFTLLLFSLAIMMAACGGGGSGTKNLGTPPGTYVLTVSGAFNSGSTSLSHNAKLSLLVQ